MSNLAVAALWILVILTLVALVVLYILYFKTRSQVNALVGTAGTPGLVEDAAAIAALQTTTASLQTQITACCATAAPQSVRFSDPASPQQIITAGTPHLVLFPNLTRETGGMVYTAGQFKVPSDGVYGVTFNCEIVPSAKLAGPSPVELQAFVSVGAPCSSCAQFGLTKVSDPDAGVTPALPAWPISCTHEVYLTAGSNLQCYVSVFNSATGEIIGAGSTFSASMAQANVTIVRMSK